MLGGGFVDVILFTPLDKVRLYRRRRFPVLVRHHDRHVLHRVFIYSHRISPFFPNLNTLDLLLLRAVFVELMEFLVL